jgi:NADPH-dependent ferric siderophore reductase
VFAPLAGEASSVRTLCRHLVDERGIDRRRLAFTGY